MCMSDPIADLLTRVRNAQAAGKVEVSMPSSRMKQALANLLRDEGYVSEVRVDENKGRPSLAIGLKYFQGQPVIESIKRVSTPGLRVYKGCNELPKVQGGLGIAIISTSKGLMTDRASRAAGQGGEVIATVY
jgi:small subunit ribosomal protein S8